MPRAYLNLRYTVAERRAAFEHGLKRCGYEIKSGLPQKPEEGAILVTWNRIGTADTAAKMFERAGLKVLVCENASWGNSFAGKRWYHIARNRHNTRHCFDVVNVDRWDSLKVELKPWRAGGETVLLPQRGIGSPPTRMPPKWPAEAKQTHNCRVRKHPGARAGGLSLEEDLDKAGIVVTWGSGAAIKACMWGIKVVSYMPDWIGQQDNTDEDRLAMFRRLAWAQWTLDEIASGHAFRMLL